MAETANLNLPDDLRGWREAINQAKDIYWKARRNGADENSALFAVLDEMLKDNFNR